MLLRKVAENVILIKEELIIMGRPKGGTNISQQKRRNCMLKKIKRTKIIDLTIAFFI